jgi:hypothetical protein
MPSSTQNFLGTMLIADQDREGFSNKFEFRWRWCTQLVVGGSRVGVTTAAAMTMGRYAPSTKASIRAGRTASARRRRLALPSFREAVDCAFSPMKFLAVLKAATVHCLPMEAG